MRNLYSFTDCPFSFTTTQEILNRTKLLWFAERVQGWNGFFVDLLKHVMNRQLSRKRLRINFIKSNKICVPGVKLRAPNVKKLEGNE